MKRKVITNIIAVFIILISFGVVLAEELTNDVKVKPESNLTYYLNIEYDGKDEEEVESGDSKTANVKSDYIEVEDQLPLGLTYVGVVGTENGSIGAVKKSDGSSCSGYVVDGTNGIKYDEKTRMVSFKVRSLGAGCKLTVGIITKTPTSNGKRQDFYNTFQALEDGLTVESNQVHAYIGDESASLHKVKYEYTGNVPDNAPSLPEAGSYAEGVSVGVKNNVSLTGYTFSGWKTADTNVSNGTFTMPSKDVTFKGSFTKKKSYKVTYEIDGEAPKKYVVPSEEEYFEHENVTVDMLSKDDIIDGYKFLGWESDDVEIEDSLFLMPNKDVTIKGKFERVKYKVSYQFQGAVMPENSASLLPAEKEYYPGDKVTLENPSKVEGYKFLGWYKKDNFVMPEEDVIIYGEWGICAGLFEPLITKDIVNKQSEYKLGDIVKFKITVTNTADYDIKNVMVRENNKSAKFISSKGYEVTSEHIATISLLKPNETVTLYAEYEVTSNSKEEEVNEAEIVGALADNKYLLNDEKEYKANVKFKVKHVVGVPSTLKMVSKVAFIISLVFIISGACILLYNYQKTRKERK